MEMPSVPTAEPKEGITLPDVPTAEPGYHFIWFFEDKSLYTHQFLKGLLPPIFERVAPHTPILEGLSPLYTDILCVLLKMPLNIFLCRKSQNKRKRKRDGSSVNV